MIKEIFSVPIYVVNNSIHLSETLSVFDSCNIEQYYAPEMYGVSGFTTFFNKEVSEKFKNMLPNIISFILDESKNYLRIMGYDVNLYKLNVATMWFTRMKENSTHNFHLHTSLGNKQTMVCGTYYLKVSKDSAPIVFSRSEGEFFNQPKLPVLQENAYTRKFYSHHPTDGDLILFLAETFHGVLCNKSIENRDGLSFNIIVEKNGNT